MRTVPGTWLAGAALTLAAALPASAQRHVALAEKDVPLKSRPAPVWAVGADEGETWEMLSNVSSLAFDTHDNLFVLDQGNFRVLVFDARGGFVRQIGKQGSGPGEFQAPFGIAIAADGSLVVLDLGHRGFTVFAADGTYRMIVPFPPEIGFPRPGELFADERGGVVTRAMPGLRMGPGAAAAPELPRTSPVVHVPLAERATATTLFEFAVQPPVVRDQRESMSGGNRTRTVMFAQPMFTKEPSWGLLPGGAIAFSNQLDYEIEIVGPAGRVESVYSRPIRARKVTKEDQEAAREQRRKAFKSPPAGATVFIAGSVSSGAGGGIRRGGPGMLSDAEIERIIEQMQFADQIPAIDRIWTDAAGRVWVARSPAKVANPTPVDLIAGGRYLGTLTDMRIPGAVSASGLAAWVERDELDIERVVVRRLPADWK